jgi:hypothetical protein
MLMQLSPWKSEAILHDWQGGFIAASSTFIPHVPSAEMAEAFAMLHGLFLANNVGCHVLEAESDSLEVVKLCSGDERTWNDATAVYAEILSQAANIGKADFKHCVRVTNIAAHELARNSFSLKSSCNWVDEPSSFLRQTLLDDVTII